MEVSVQMLYYSSWSWQLSSTCQQAAEHFAITVQIMSPTPLVHPLKPSFARRRPGQDILSLASMAISQASQNSLRVIFLTVLLLCGPQSGDWGNGQEMVGMRTIIPAIIPLS